MSIYEELEKLNAKCDRLATTMGLTVGRVEFSPSQTEVEELRAEMAMLRAEREILRKERDEAREAFAVATSQAVEAREMLRRIMDWAPCLPDYEPDAQHLKWQADAFAARKFLEGAK